jgi:hypothetical protein
MKGAPRLPAVGCERDQATKAFFPSILCEGWEDQAADLSGFFGDGIEGQS